MLNRLLGALLALLRTIFRKNSPVTPQQAPVAPPAPEKETTEAKNFPHSVPGDFMWESGFGGPVKWIPKQSGGFSVSQRPAIPWEEPVTPKVPPPTEPWLRLWLSCMASMTNKGHVIDSEIGGGNIVFVSGRNIDGMPADNARDEWNDFVFVARKGELGWYVPFGAKCTTEPGIAPALSKDAKERGGVARIVPGQYFAWKLGFHKQSKYGKSHPAFVQAAPVWITRDHNQDLKWTGENAYHGMFGINIHAQGKGKASKKVGFNSEGCLVLESFDKLMELIEIAKDFNCAKQSGEDTIFAATIIEGLELP